MMATILAKNPLVYTFKEIHFFERILHPSIDKQPLSRNQAENLGALLLGIEFEGHFFLKKPEKYLEESRKMLTSCNNKSLSHTEIYKIFLSYVSTKNSKKRPCKQTPQNIFYIKDILKIIPRAKFIHIVRDPRAVLLSQKYKWKRRYRGGSTPFWESCRTWSNYHPLVISKLWKSSVGAGYNFLDHPHVFTIRFEDLVISPQNQLRKLCNFLGLEYSHQMLDIPHRGSSNAEDNHNKRGINPSIAEKWKKGLSATEIYWCQAINKNLMNKFDYSILPIQINYFSIAWSCLLLPCKLLLAIIFNYKRFKSIFHVIKRRIL